MKFIEESHARELHRDLRNAFANAMPEIIVALKGAGVHWDCTVKRGERECCIHCFDVKGPEYLTSFDQQKGPRATGRTSSKSETIAAANLWIEGCDVSQLYGRFQFVDQQKRSLSSIESMVVAVCPELNRVTRELKHQVCDLYELWFQEKERSCRISYYGKNLNPDAVFHWDESRIFAVQTGDFNQLAPILKRWLCDHVIPSELQKEYPSLEMGKVARYYEEGRSIEGEFIESWDRIERFYEEMNVPPAEAIRTLVKTMREKGYDRTLRAGQSLYTLILARSRRHGLRDGQPNIAFQFSAKGMNVCPKNLVGAEVAVSDFVLTDAVELQLQKLAAVTID